MIFPFAITRRFKLSDKEYSSYCSEEIIDKIYDGIIAEKFNIVMKNERTIVFKGDFSRAIFSFIPTDYYTYCLDYGKVKIEESKGHRIILYKFHFFRVFLFYSIIGIGLSSLIGIMTKTLEYGSIALVIYSILLLINWLLVFFMHPLIISNTLEFMRIEAMKKVNKK